MIPSSLRVAALRPGPSDRRIEVGDEFGVGLGVDHFHDRRNVGHFRQVDAKAEIIIRRDGEGAELGQPASDVADIFVDPEYLHRHQDDRRMRHAFRPREIDRHVAAPRRNRRAACDQALRVGRNGPGPQRPRRQRIAPAAEADTKARRDSDPARRQAAAFCNRRMISPPRLDSIAIKSCPLEVSTPRSGNAQRRRNNASAQGASRPGLSAPGDAADSPTRARHRG